MEGKKLPSILPRHYSYRGTGKRSEILAAEVEGFRQPFAKAEDVPDLGLTLPVLKGDRQIVYAETPVQVLRLEERLYFIQHLPT